MNLYKSVYVHSQKEYLSYNILSIKNQTKFGVLKSS